MASITPTVHSSHKLHGNSPATELDWAGQPMRIGEAYGGRPEHMDASQRMAEARRARKPMTPERLAILRASMAKARAALGKRRRGKVASKVKGEGDGSGG